MAATGQVADDPRPRYDRNQVVVEDVRPVVDSEPGRTEGVICRGLSPDLAGLGRPEPVGHDPTGQQLGQLRLGRRRQDRPAGSDGHDRRQVVAVGIGGQDVEERPGHGVAHHHDGVGPLGLHEVPDLFGVEPAPGSRHDLPPAEQGGEGQPVAGGVHEGGNGEGGDPGAQHSFRQLFGPGDDVARRERVAPAHGGEEDVVVAPQDPFGHAGGAPGVDAVNVGGRPSRKVPSFVRGAQHLLVVVGHSARRRPVGHLEDGPALGQGTEGAGDGRSEPAVEDQAHQAGVVVEVLEFAGDIAVVDVDRNRPDLEAGQHDLDVLGPVGQLHPDTVTCSDPGGGQVVSETVGPPVEVPVGEAARTCDHGFGIGHLIGDELVEIRQVQLHPRPSPHSVKGLPALPSRHASHKYSR